MKLKSTTSHAGFTLIEILVVIAILAALVSIATPAIYSQMGAGDEAKCRANLEQLVQIGAKYGQDMSHRNLLPTSGMDDDEDTETVNEKDGWWIALAPELDAVVFPRTPNGKMKVSSIFHCPSDKRVQIGNDSTFAADEKSISYVSWTDSTEDLDNPNSCIRTTAKQNLDGLPWLSDGMPVKGKSVTKLADFEKMVMPAAERHNGKILVAYASGLIKAIEIDEDEADAEKIFKKMAPTLAARKPGADEDSEDDADEEYDDEEE